MFNRYLSDVNCAVIRKVMTKFLLQENPCKAKRQPRSCAELHKDALFNKIMLLISFSRNKN